MGIFSKQVIVNDRTTRKEIAAQLDKCYWSISELGKFLKQRGVELPVQITDYDRFRKIAKLCSASGDWYELKITNSQEARESSREDPISLDLREFYQNTQDNYWEFWLTKCDKTTRYQVGFSPATYEVGKSIRLENSTVKTEYGKIFNRYQLFTANGVPRILIEVTNPLSAIRGGYINIQKTRDIEEYLEGFECLGGPNSAEEILKEVSKCIGFDINLSEDVRIMCQPMGTVSQKKINITKIVKSNGKVKEFEAEEGTSRYTWKEGSYSYEDPERRIWYDCQKEKYGATAKWKGNAPKICDAVIFTISDTIYNLKKRLEK